MFSARSWAHDRQVRSLPWANKCWHVQPSSGAGVRFFRNGCGGKSVRTNIGHTTGKWGADHGLRKSDMSKQALEPVPLFLKTGSWSNVSARYWAHDRKVRSLPWANKFWHAQLSSSAGVRFFRNGCGANLLAYTLDSRWESEVLTMGWENLICPSELRRLDRCFWKRVWQLMFSAKSWPQDRTTRSLPWAKIFCHV